ncbi:FAD-dependent oxidoreductase [Sinomonas humi]|uniref:FAD-dependent oxidoreductase n=1 Tax=Sinomonas humi TaxID=1338436 RepID=UPI0006905127|nr:FAD-dependent oxidoreductase [Sinomonas humi]
MPHLILSNCCNDASCVPVCPVDCIHPTPDEPDYQRAEMLYIDPDVCIDCGACIPACPVGAIIPDTELGPRDEQYLKLNADYYTATGSAADRQSEWADPLAGQHPAAPDAEPLRVAVVGGGAAGHYTAAALLDRVDVRARVDIFERLCTPGGLVRFGVAPDHLATKRVLDNFTATRRRSGVRTFFNTEVGRDITHEELAERYHAVVYAVGAIEGRSSGLSGENLHNSASAAEFVAWFNGHPEFADASFDLSHERVVVLGNGNVALDVARILTTDPDDLAETDIADHALNALRGSRVREVILVARRGPEYAAFTSPELLGLMSSTSVALVVDPSDLESANTAVTNDELERYYQDQKLALLGEIASKGTPPGDPRRIVFKFGATPTLILGENAVTGVRVVSRGTEATIDCGLVLRAVGFRGSAVDGVPYDDDAGIIPNDGGRVIDPERGGTVAGVYATGWIKRGSTGGIGANKACANATVAAIVEDFEHGRLSATNDPDDLVGRLDRSFNDVGAQAIDDYEIQAGTRVQRPRVKIVDQAHLISIGLTAGREQGALPTSLRGK